MPARCPLCRAEHGRSGTVDDVFTEYNASFRLGSRTRSGESYADETSYFTGEVLTARW